MAAQANQTIIQFLPIKIVSFSCVVIVFHYYEFIKYDELWILR